MASTNLGSMKDTNSHASHEGLDDVGKRRRIARACEQCRKKKIKCDGEQTCSNCIAYRTDCTFTEAPKKRAPPRGAKYIAALEDRLQKMERILGETRSAVFLGTDTSRDFRPLEVSSIPSTESRDMSDRTESYGGFVRPHTEGASKDDNDGTDDLAEKMGFLFRHRNGESEYMGASNSATMLLSAQKQVGEILGDGSFSEFLRQSQDRADAKERQDDLALVSNIAMDFPHPKKPVIPDRATCLRYIQVYFEHTHHIYPLLDKKEFLEKSEQMHRPNADFDWSFSCIYLMVLAFGSNIYHGTPMEQNSGPGYQFYATAHKLSYSFAHITSLQTVHALMMIAMYLENTHRVQFLWMTLGFVIRMSQTLGLHRNLNVASATGPDEQSTVESMRSEVRRRTFWIIYLMDNNLVVATGKPAGIQDFDCDQELPSITDDEIRQSGGLKFADGSPFSYLHAQIQLARISHQAQRRLYSVRALSLTPEQVCDRISDLDAKLLAWVTTLPPEFNPNNININNTHGLKRDSPPAPPGSELAREHYNHLITLMQIRYFNLKMTVHRRNMKTRPATTTPPPLSEYHEIGQRTEASHSIAVQAARSCLDTLSSGLPRTENVCININLAYPAAAVLVLFANLIWNPGNTTACDDVEKIKSITSYIHPPGVDADKGIHLAQDFFTELTRVAELAIAKAQSHGTKRGWKDNEEQTFDSTFMPGAANSSNPYQSGGLINDPYAHMPGMSDMLWASPMGVYGSDMRAATRQEPYANGGYNRNTSLFDPYLGTSNYAPRPAPVVHQTMHYDGNFDHFLWPIGNPDEQF